MADRIAPKTLDARFRKEHLFKESYPQLRGVASPVARELCGAVGRICHANPVRPAEQKDAFSVSALPVCRKAAFHQKAKTKASRFFGEHPACLAKGRAPRAAAFAGRWPAIIRTALFWVGLGLIRTFDKVAMPSRGPQRPRQNARKQIARQPPFYFSRAEMIASLVQEKRRKSFPVARCMARHAGRGDWISVVLCLKWRCPPTLVQARRPARPVDRASQAGDGNRAWRSRLGRSHLAFWLHRPRASVSLSFALLAHDLQPYPLSLKFAALVRGYYDIAID